MYVCVYRGMLRTYPVFCRVMAREFPMFEMGVNKASKDLVGYIMRALHCGFRVHGIGVCGGFDC